MFSGWIETVGATLDLIGVALIVIGLVLAAGRYISNYFSEATLDAYQRLRQDIGRAILLGLEVLVAADIIRTVAVTPTGRTQFYVALGAAVGLPGLLYRMGWDDAGLDLRALGRGAYVTAPPSDLGGLGPVRWLRPPDPGTTAAPPQARLLLGTLAYICHRW